MNLQDPNLPSHLKPVLYGLARDNPATPEGKYLVKRRDGTVPEWPSFVLGAADPVSPWALRTYAVVGTLTRVIHWRLGLRLWRLASEFSAWRRAHKTGDPGRGLHRRDDPATVAEMRKGMSA